MTQELARNATQAATVTVRNRAATGLTWDEAQYSFNQGGPPLPTMSNILFSNLTLNGAAVNSAATMLGNDLYNGATGHTLMVAGPVNSGGNAFRDVFKMAS
jgi:hypothetical protein